MPDIKSQINFLKKSVSRRNILKTLMLTPFAGALKWGASSKPMAKNTFSEKPQVAVIGAGAFGGWTALHLLRMGARVTLLDAWGPGNSRASSGGESRVIRGLYGDDRIYIELVSRSFQLWRENEERWHTKLYHKTGTLWMFSVDDTYAQKSLPLAEEFGLKVDTLSPEDVKKRYPQIDLNGVHTCYYEHESGYIAARLSCQYVRQAFIHEGGAYRQAAVEPGAITSGSMDGIRLSDGTNLQADQYVFACGPWLGKVFPDVIGERVQPSRQEVYYFGTPYGSLEFSQSRLPIWADFGEKLFYGIPGGDHRGFKVADDTRGPVFDPTSGDRTPTQEGIAEARHFLSKRFPGMATAPLLEARVCQYENSPDGNFIVDRHPEAKNVWILGGGSGHGFKLSPALGERVAKQVLDKMPADAVFMLSRLDNKQKRKTQFSTKKEK